MRTLSLLLILLMVSGSILAQVPTGTITGFITDLVGARVAGAHITIVNSDTRLTRNLLTANDGSFSASALPTGVYNVSAEANSFRRMETTVSVNAGTTTTLNLTLQPGNLSELVTVNNSVPFINYESHQVSGVINREQIESIPLNGRNFLDLAKLEPGVTTPIRGSTNRIFVPILGAGTQNSPRIGQTRVTVDGADIASVNAIGPALQVSQDTVEQFQLTSINFDLATSLTTAGAINIVTRSGGTDFHGSGFFFYRDNNLSAYPALSRDPTNPHPFFQREQFGSHFSGPIKKDRAFVFVAFEHNNQKGVLAVQPHSPDFAPLGGIFSSPYRGNQFDLRFDVPFNSRNNSFIRYIHDGNSLFGPFDGRNVSLPSAWSKINNWVDQTVFGLTTVVSQNLINELHLSYFFSSSPEIPATSDDCPGCLGVGGAPITIQDAGLSIGSARRLSAIGRRYQVTESMVWQRENHRWRFGIDWERGTPSSSNVSQEPASLDLYSPQDVRIFNASASPSERIPLPTTFLTLNDILQLPLRSYTTSVGPGETLQSDFRKYRIADLYRIYGGDTWHMNPRLTVNYGLAWSYEPHTLNVTLTKPALLAPILGPDHLNPAKAPTTNFSPMLGFAWAATRDNKTVIRGGGGLYYDPILFNSIDTASERQALFPAGTGRRSLPGSAISVPGLGVLDFQTLMTSFTGADLLSLLPGIRSAQESRLNPDNRDFSVRNIDLDKTGTNLTDPYYRTPYALHFNVGVQREISHELVLTADFAWRRFLHTFIPDIDYNRFKSAQGPVIKLCVSSEQQNDPNAVCSRGQITFDNTSGIAQYKGLLVRLEKRFSQRTQFLASYALGSFVGSNGNAGLGNPATGFNNYNWFENYGPLPTDVRHILNVSGLIDLPRKFQVSYSVSYYSAPPFSAYVANADFNGDGTVNDLLPGTKVNEFNRGLNKADLVRLVQDYNQHYAGNLTLPADYSFNDSFFTHDLRVSRSFNLRNEQSRLNVFAEIFNLFNIANLVQFSGNLGDSSSFGKPGARFSQVFGSGGPRAIQFGAQITF